MQQDDAEGLKIRCPYCHKVFMVRKKIPTSEKSRVRFTCPSCGQEVLLPGEKLVQACRAETKR